MKTRIAAAALLSLASASAFAANDYGAANPSGPYIGAGWGQLHLDVHNLSDVGTATTDILKGKDNAWKLFGGWQFNPYFALEAAYIDFGRPNDRFTATGSNGNYALSMSGFAPYVVGSLPLGPMEVFAKVGSYFYDAKLRVNFDNPGPSLESSHRRNDFLYGGGLGYVFAGHIRLRAEYEVVDVKNASSSNSVWLSGAWLF